MKGYHIKKGLDRVNIIHKLVSDFQHLLDVDGS